MILTTPFLTVFFLTCPVLSSYHFTSWEETTRSELTITTAQTRWTHSSKKQVTITTGDSDNDNNNNENNTTTTTTMK